MAIRCDRASIRLLRGFDGEEGVGVEYPFLDIDLIERWGSETGIAGVLVQSVISLGSCLDGGNWGIRPFVDYIS